MSSYNNYDYSPLSTNHKPRHRKAWIWPACFGGLLIFNVAVFWFYPRQPLAALDDYQRLNEVSVVNTSAIPPLAQNDHAIVSSLYTDAFATAAITLGHSLKAHNMTARMILIYLPDRISERTKCLVTAAGWMLHPVRYIPPPHNGKGVTDRFKDQYTKLNIWTLDSLGVKSLIYLDADTLVRGNFDELFALPFNFAAVPDVFEDRRGYTIGFNAGVMLLRPSTAVFNDMLVKIETARYPPVFAEQAFLNLYFGVQAVRLPYAYNGNLALKKRTPALWKALIPDMRIVHYTLEKPFPTSEQMAPQEVEDFVHSSRSLHDGFWNEEFSWWEQSFKETKIERQAAWDQCSRA